MKKNVLLDEELVSVIIPIYNSQQYLRACIKSVVGQTYGNIEIILVDDGSTDNSGKICDEYALSDKRIKVVHTKNNGQSVAKNKGIESSKGSLIFFADSDDCVKKGAISLLIGNYHQHRADMTIGDFEIMGRKIGLRGEKWLFSDNKLLKKEEIVDYVINYLKKPTGYSFFIFNWAKLYKRSIIKNYNIRFKKHLPVFEDVDFNFEYLKFADSVSYVKNRIYVYEIFNDAVSAGMKIYQNPLAFKVSIETVKKFLISKNVSYNIIKKQIGNAHIFFIIRTMVRFFSLNGKKDYKKIYELIKIIINDSEIRRDLRFYSPTKGDSRVLPFLVKLKLIWLIMIVCGYKARKIK